MFLYEQSLHLYVLEAPVIENVSKKKKKRNVSFMKLRSAAEQMLPLLQVYKY